MKTRQSLSVHVIVLSTFYISGSNGTATTTLLPQTVETTDNTNVTLTCSYGDQNAGPFQFGSFQWILKLPGQDTYSTVYVSINDCKTPAWLADSNLYSYRCISDTSHSVTLINISHQRNGETWSCAFWDGLLLLSSSNSVSMLVIVPVRLVTISPNTTILTEAERVLIDFSCTSSPCRPCRPTPKFRWYITHNANPGGTAAILTEIDPIESQINTLNSYSSRLSITLNRIWNNWFLFCGANTSIGDVILSAKIQINVIYPPDGPPRIETFENGSELKIIKDSSVMLKCLITGGNPLPRLEWNKNNQMSQIVSGTTVTKNITWHAIDKTKDELRCESIQLASRYTTILYVTVLYPPETPTIKIKTSSGAYLQVYNTLHVIEGLPFTLNCSADSNPPVSLIQWNDLMPTNSSIYYVANADRRYAENIVCKVSNTMQASDSSTPTTGNNITFLEVNVLYPPTMNIEREATIVEGDNLDNICNFTRGNPTDSNITWSWNGIIWNLNSQQPHIVSRNQSGVYRCSLQYLMVSSDGTRVFGNASGEFNLSVQYKTSVLRFVFNEQHDRVNIIIKENDAVNLTCDIEGLPLPTGQLLHHSFQNQLVTELPRYITIQTSTILRLTSFFPAQCTDSGMHTCAGTNLFYNGRQSTSNKSIELFVMCKPRMSPYITIPDTVACPTSVDVTLSFTALAYPVPPKSGYVWTRKVDTSDTWVNITSSGSKSQISTRGLQSNLTIKDVSQSDYGMYRLFIFNDVGQYSHTFNLVPSGYTNDVTSAPSTNTSVVAAGAATGGVAFLVVFIIIVVVFKKRLQNKKHDSLRQSVNVNISNEVDGRGLAVE